MVTENFAHTLETYMPDYITLNYPEVTEVNMKVVADDASNSYKIGLEVKFTGKVRVIKWRKLPEHIANDWSNLEVENLSVWNVKYTERKGTMSMTFEITEDTDEQPVDEEEND